MTKLNTSSGTVTTLRTPVLGSNVNSFSQVLMTEVGSLKRDVGGIKSDSANYKSDMNKILTRMSADISTFFIQLQDIKPEKLNEYITSKLNNGLVSLHDELVKKVDDMLSGQGLSPEVRSALVETIKSDVENKIKDVLDDAISQFVSDKLKTFGSEMHVAYNELSGRLDVLQSKLDPTLDGFLKTIVSLEGVVDNVLNDAVADLKRRTDELYVIMGELKTRYDAIDNIDVIQSGSIEEIKAVFADLKGSISALQSEISLSDSKVISLEGEIDSRFTKIEEYVKKVSDFFGGDPNFEGVKVYMSVSLKEVYDTLKEYIDSIKLHCDSFADEVRPALNDLRISLSNSYNELTAYCSTLRSDIEANYKEIKPLAQKTRDDLDRYYAELSAGVEAVNRELDGAKEEYRSMIENGLKDDGAVIGELVQVKQVVDDHTANIVSMLSDVGLLKNDVQNLYVSDTTAQDTIKYLSDKLNSIISTGIGSSGVITLPLSFISNTDSKLKELLAYKSVVDDKLVVYDGEFTALYDTTLKAYQDDIDYLKSQVNTLFSLVSTANLN